MKSTNLIMMLLFASLFIGCPNPDGPEPEPEPEPTPEPAVVFSIASQNTTLVYGNEGILFYATPAEDVVLVKAEIKNPVGDIITYNLNSTTYISGQAISLQDAGMAYIKVSGTWTFTFTGSRATGTKSSFVSVATVNVGA